MVLGLDISTSISGFCVLDNDGNVFDIGAINFKKHGKDIIKKFEQVEEWINNYEHFDKITTVIIEAPLRSFAKGQSSATTLFNLHSFNVGIQYMVYKKTGKPAKTIGARTARKKLGIVMPKGLKYNERKKFIFGVVSTLLENVTFERTRFGNPKQECFDMCDSWVIARSEWEAKNKK
jgi:hypothetical protein